MNEAILLILMLIILLSIFVFYKIFDKQGFIYILIILNIMAFIMSFKISTIFNSNINIGIIPLIGICTVIYIYLIKYDKKEYADILKISTYVNVVTAISIIIANYFIPAITDNTAINITDTFIDNYKTIIIYPLMILLSEYTICRLYNLLVSVKTNQQLIVILTYIISSLIYTVLFNVIININILTFKNAIFLGISTYILGLIITIFTVAYIYIFTNKKKVKK